MLPHAAGYSRSTDGHLVADATPSTAPGHLSIFRAGMLVPIQPATPASQGAPDPQAPPLSLLYLSWGTLVSPDGTYAVMNARLGAHLPLSSTPLASTLDPQICGFYAYGYACDYARYTPPDAGLTAVDAVAAAGYTYSPVATQTFTQWNTVDIAYRPNGNVLAAILPDAVAPHSAVKRITLFNATSGAQIGVVSAPTNPNASSYNPGVSSLTWSPLGNQLAYFDFGSSTITIWGGSSLPK